MKKELVQASPFKINPLLHLEIALETDKNYIKS